MFIKDEISKRLNAFVALCKEHQIRYLYAFGSSTNNIFNSEKSDIDLLVEIDEPDPVERGEKLISLWDTFELFFKIKVDLLTENSIKNTYLRKSINKTKILIYDGRTKKIPV